jgi:nucleotide-binding universal stress UspA family protein
MSKIIVATDFAESSHNAFLHALSLAKNCASDLCLVWVKKSPSEKDKFDSRSEPVKEVTAQFEAIIAKYGQELPGNKITYKIRTGKVYKEIVDEANESEAMMIIAGTHGASVFLEFWIGSNANRIVSLSHCPVITIRAGIDIDRPLKRILLPIDSTPETRQKASFTGYLAKKHHAEILILSMYTTTLRDVKMKVDLYARQVAEYLEKDGVKCSLDGLKVENFADDMIGYANKMNANLISVMKDQESSASNLWMGPNTQQIVNRSPLPVLVIHSKDTSKGGLGF